MHLGVRVRAWGSVGAEETGCTVCGSVCSRVVREVELRHRRDCSLVVWLGILLTSLLRLTSLMTDESVEVDESYDVS